MGFDMSLAAPEYMSIPEDRNIAKKLLLALADLDQVLLSKYGTSKYEMYCVAASMRLAQEDNNDKSNPSSSSLAYGWALK
eukprot:CAMPEP_0114366038 /NCGR_PEP_ID=MMETSP0101-20121206/28920_1 /TAXON_ID=38822 ORGANISM="Pteridomonas danica, Strain PT" /NCGR_SAMPLE_ID=MMETSP0101 /ASSEMBLY_ACC=CAM_ASM_000211 /LENGTH=79 /DNA_ID=CAMNT_0001514787 /DNA_START=17 /DNA_END=253 /DNA_ORIENTATION=-